MLTSRKLIPIAFLFLGIILTGCAPSPQADQSPSKAVSVTWESKLVRRPGDAPEDGKIYLVKDGKKHWITHSSWIGAHASEYTATVQTITASDLDKIPLGDPITTER